MNTKSSQSKPGKKSRDPKAHKIFAVNASGEVVGIADLQEDIEINKIKLSSERAENTLKSNRFDVVITGTTDESGNNPFIYTTTFEVDDTDSTASPKNSLDVTHKKPVQKKGVTTKGGIPMPDPKEGELLMKSTGKRASHREFWTDPAKGWNDDANKKQAHYQSRISRDTEGKVNAFLKATGMKKVALTDEALKSFIEGYQYTDEELNLLQKELNLE